MVFLFAPPALDLKSRDNAHTGQITTEILANDSIKRKPGNSPKEAQKTESKWQMKR